MIRIDVTRRAFLRFKWVGGPQRPVCYMPMAVYREWSDWIRSWVYSELEGRVDVAMRAIGTRRGQ